MKSPKSNEFQIAPDWGYTRTITGDGVSFLFHSSASCPGYALTLSSWRLHKGDSTRPTVASKGDATHLGDGALSQLKQIFGRNAFARLDHATDRFGQRFLEVAKALRLDTTRLPRVTGLANACTMPDESIEELSNLYRSINVAMITDLLAPKIAPLGVALFTLTVRNQAPYSVTDSPWPFGGPPRTLRHLATTGFESPIPWGVLADSLDGDDQWVVSHFAKREVHMHEPPMTAIHREFPQLTDLLSGDFRRDIAELLATMRTDRLAKGGDRKALLRRRVHQLRKTGEAKDITSALRIIVSEEIKKAKVGGANAKGLLIATSMASKVHRDLAGGATLARPCPQSYLSRIRTVSHRAAETTGPADARWQSFTPLGPVTPDKGGYRTDDGLEKEKAE